VLERVNLVFHTSQYITTDPVPHTITLPYMQRMYLSTKDEKVAIRHILKFLRLPNRTLLDVGRTLRWSSPTLPIASFSECLQNLSRLPEMRVYTDDAFDVVDSLSPSQAALEYWAEARPMGETLYRYDHKLWGGLPLHSVRRLTAMLHRRALKV
jgi:hypothetical protein